MKSNIIPAIRLTLVCILVFIVLYPFFIWVIAQITPAGGKGETVMINNKVIGYKLEGQNFSADKYFWSRPSAVGYNAAGSAGSNKGPSNPAYLQEVQARIDTFLIHNPGIKKEDIPSDMVTASGSGLDPDISPASAEIQVKRIATVRKMSETAISELVQQQIRKPLLGLLGTETVNVLQLNIALDKLQ